MAGLRFCKQPITVHTDGSCLKNPDGAGGWAAVIRMHGKLIEIYGSEPSTTNNRMEMMAALKALEALPDGADVYLHTDSRYVQQGILHWVRGWAQRGWKTQSGGEVANRDLWEALMQQNDRLVISWIWVRGHDGDPMNERCDELAGLAARSVQSVAELS